MADLIENFQESIRRRDLIRQERAAIAAGRSQAQSRLAALRQEEEAINRSFNLLKEREAELQKHVDIHKSTVDDIFSALAIDPVIKPGTSVGIVTSVPSPADEAIVIGNK